MITNAIYLIIAFALALVVSVFLYFYPNKKRYRFQYGLAVLRFISVFTLLVLLINPKWEKTKVWLVKPNLVVAVDNSSSISYINASKKVVNFVSTLQNDTELQDKFKVSYLRFGKNVQQMDTLSFGDSQTNQTAALEQLDALYSNKSKKEPILFITDGNQTLGNDYGYYHPKNSVYPIVVGDTTHYDDIVITQLNTNQYSWLDNEFPVEIFSLYKGSKTVNSVLSVYEGGKRIYQKRITFSKKHNSVTTRFTTTSKKLGVHFYHVVLEPIANEKNLRNNRRDFSIEVLDQKANILLLSSFYHPDLGAIKKSIERNKQRKLSLRVADFKNINFSDYQLVILYQPTEQFASVFPKIEKAAVNSFIITGTHTNWNILNKYQSSFRKDITSKLENFLPVYNASFSEYGTKNIGFDQWPPLRGIFGTPSFLVPYQSLLSQKIGGVTTNYPLLATYKEAKAKKVVLFGEGIWKWRMNSILQSKSSEDFDRFFGSLIQYASQYSKHDQIHLDYPKLCFSNQSQVITAFFVDQNYQINSDASLWLHLTNKKDNSTKKIPFSLANESYKVTLDELTEGNYQFKVSVEGSSQMAYGGFKVLDYDIEQQYSTANIDRLKLLTANANTNIGDIDNPEKSIAAIKNNPQFKSIQKSKKVSVPIINWYWLLGIIIVSLSTEWFIRKYKGLI